MPIVAFFRRSLAVTSSATLAAALISLSCWTSHDARLFRSASDGDLETVKWVIQKGANVNARDAEGETPLMYAAVRGQTAIVLFLLSKGAQINIVSANGQTALDRAAQGGETEVVKALIERGANVELGAPLLDAAAAAHFDTVRLLIENGANVNVQDTAGDTVLEYAARQGAPVEIVKKMIGAGADVNHRNTHGKTAEALAIETHHGEIAELLAKVSPK